LGCDNKSVAKIANRILEASKDVPEIFGKNWTVYLGMDLLHDSNKTLIFDRFLVSEADENAFVLPNGHIFVFGGMWTRCSDSDGQLNEDKLAIILGHEMAHAILGHSEEKLSPCMLVPMAVIWAFMPSDGIAFITHWFIKKAMDIFEDLPFSREMEMEADTSGLKLAAKACFDVREAPAFWMVMELLEDSGSILINCTKDDEEAKISEDFKTIHSPRS
jgi:Zn-dependent protease with chaperone function